MMIPQQLPDAEAELLQEIREKGNPALPALRGRVALLRDAGWTLAAIGSPIGANRSTTRMWETAAKHEDRAAAALIAAITPAPVRPTEQKTIRVFPDVPLDERADLVRLAESARTVRGHTPKDAQARKDAQEFESRLRDLVARGVPMKRIADRLGVTHHAISARLARRLSEAS